MKDVIINTSFIRLGALLKFIGEATSGTDAKKIILQKSVDVNGENCTIRGKKITSNDIVCVEDRKYRILSQ